VNLTEAAVILFGLFAGYWVVGKLFFRAPKSGDVHTDPPIANQVAEPPWYETLQVAPSATEQEIRDAYKLMISQYHPDKVDRLGQEIRDLANRKSQEISLAYRAGLRARGAEP
jgi:hypothetical protein